MLRKARVSVCPFQARSLSCKGVPEFLQRSQSFWALFSPYQTRTDFSLLKYHAIGNYYLKFSWECSMQTNIQNIFLYCGQPNILGNFLLFVGQSQLGENYLIYSHIWGPQNTLGKKCITYSGYSGPSK